MKAFLLVASVSLVPFGAAANTTGKFLNSGCIAFFTFMDTRELFQPDIQIYMEGLIEGLTLASGANTDAANFKFWDSFYEAYQEVCFKEFDRPVRYVLPKAFQKAVTDSEQ
ncbi:hypothetical protein LZG00_15880 [Rhodobacteraceae bacterium LMO-12]|nr:hypothetical protein [Rhodobacteraceae bacterium LMO-JJ12]